MPLLTQTTQEGNPLWILEGRNTALALAIAEHGRLVIEYWGTRLASPADYASSASGHPHVSFDALLDTIPLAFPVSGDPLYKEPCMQVIYHDGVRAVYLKYISADVDEANEILSIHLEDPVYNLNVTLIFANRPEDDLVIRQVRISNAGDQSVTLEAAASGAIDLPATGYDLCYLRGMWGYETQFTRTPLSYGKFTLESRRGITSHQANPWFAVVPRGQTTDQEGQAWFGGLAWSGNWSMTFEVMPAGLLHIVAGINPFDFTWHLAPGETFVTPELVLGYTSRGLGAAARNLHAYQRREVLPPSHRMELRPVLYNSWEATEFNIDVDSQRALARLAASIGVELFVVDDGWFGARDSDRAGLGDWIVNPRKFPQGLHPLIHDVEQLGMKFGLWVEPEMVNPDSDLYRAHPDWILHFPHRPRTLQRNQSVLNFARQDVRDYIHEQLQRLLRENDIYYLKWDMNRPFTEAGWPEAPPERQREVWMRYVRGVYEVMEALRYEFPTLMIEGCSGGGGRVDMGIMRYVDQFWTSDNTDAWDRLSIQYGFSHAFNAKVMVCWVTDSPNPYTRRIIPLKFRFDVAMMGTLGIGGHLAHWTEVELAEARDGIAFYKRIRPLVQEGNQYWIKPPVSTGQSSIAYVAPDASAFVLFVYQGHGTGRIDPVYHRLQGLDPDRIYRREDGLTASGAALMGAGIPVRLRNDFASVVMLWQAI